MIKSIKTRLLHLIGVGLILLKRRDDIVTDKLKSLGLTGAESVLYQQLVEMGPSSIGKLASRCGMDMAVAYRKAKSLVRMGLLEVKLGLPSLYVPRDIGQSMDLLVEKSEAELRNKRDAAAELKQRLMLIAAMSSMQQPETQTRATSYRLVIGQKQLFEEAHKLRANATLELLLIVPASGFGNFVTRGHAEEVTNCRRRGLSVRVITGLTKGTEQQVKELSTKVEVRYCAGIAFRLGIYDKAKAHLGAAYEEKASDGSKDVYLIIEDRAFAKSMWRLFELIWDVSKPIS